MERRDEAEEEERCSQQGAAEFPGIVEAESYLDFGQQNMSGRRQAVDPSHQLGRDGRLDENKA